MDAWLEQHWRWIAALGLIAAISVFGRIHRASTPKPVPVPPKTVHNSLIAELGRIF